MNFPMYCIQHIIVKSLLIFVIIGLLVLIGKDIAYLNRILPINNAIKFNSDSDKQIQNIFQLEKEFSAISTKFETDSNLHTESEIVIIDVNSKYNSAYQSSTLFAEITEDSISISDSTATDDIYSNVSDSKITAETIRTTSNSTVVETANISVDSSVTEIANANSDYSSNKSTDSTNSDVNITSNSRSFRSIKEISTSDVISSTVFNGTTERNFEQSISQNYTDLNDFDFHLEQGTNAENFTQLYQDDSDTKYLLDEIPTTLKKTTVSFSNSSSFDETILSNETLNKLKNIIQCDKVNYVSEIRQKGEYWVYVNYVKADHGDLECYQDVTLATHGSFPFLDNVEILVERWSGPISIAIYAPGTDFYATLDSIQYLRQCSSQKSLIRQWVTFHVYFHGKYAPDKISPKMEDNIKFNCSLPPPYPVESDTTFRSEKKLTYPVNVGRNIARDYALTYYIFSLDIELYPVPYLGAMFLNMLARDSSLIQGARPRVFATKPFEITDKSKIPDSKKDLIKMIKKGTAIVFHQNVCRLCHRSPLTKAWMKQGQTKYMEITGVGKRINRYANWEAVFICTKNDPAFDERLSWEGKSDKMTQSYIMCLLDYDFLMLSNAFVVHRPGIKVLKQENSRNKFVVQTNRLIKNVIRNEYKEMYGERKGCKL